jgi:hypothetical protein
MSLGTSIETPIRIKILIGRVAVETKDTVKNDAGYLHTISKFKVSLPKHQFD